MKPNRFIRRLAVLVLLYPVLAGARSTFFLYDATGTVIENTNIPTNLNNSAWISARSEFDVYETITVVVDGVPQLQKVWIVTASIDTITPAGPIALASPAVQQAAAPEWCTGPLPVQNISDTLVCKDCTGPDGNGIYTCNPANCAPKTAVERNIMEKSGDGSEYCYYTKTNERVCKQI